MKRLSYTLIDFAVIAAVSAALCGCTATNPVQDGSAAAGELAFFLSDSIVLGGLCCILLHRAVRGKVRKPLNLLGFAAGVRF